MVEQYLALDDGSVKSQDEIAKMRKQREKIKDQLDKAIEQQTPMKWVNRVIMWCADKMPSFGDAFLPESPKSAPDAAAAAKAVVEKAMANNAETVAMNDRRKAVMKKYNP